MFATPALPKPPAPLPGRPQDMLIQFLPLVGSGRPVLLPDDPPAAAADEGTIRRCWPALKRGDTVVLPSGVIGKIVRVEDADVGVEIATGVTVKVRKA